MSRSRWAISLFLLWHVLAMVAGAIPQPSTMPVVAGVRHPQDDPIASAVTPRLDRLALGFSALHRSLWAALGWTHGVTRPYLGTLGLTQRFRMFANPPKRDEYLRVRYFVESRPARDWMATELVYPAHREDRIRLLQAFRDSYRDKAVEISLARHHATDLQEAPAPGARPESEALTPIARYFASVFEATRLEPGERLVRVEVWHGSARGAPRGSTDEVRAAERMRRDALRRYYDGPIVDTPVRYSPFLATEQESDIAWILEHIAVR